MRLALAAATNRDAYVTAIGGATAADPARSLVPAGLPAAHDADPVGTGTRGDAVARQGPARGGREDRPGALHGRLPLHPDGGQGDGRARRRMAARRVRADDPPDHRRLLHRDQRPGARRRRSTCSGRTGRPRGPRPRRSCRPCSTARSTSPRPARDATTATGTTPSSTPAWPRSRRSPTAPPARRPGPRSTSRCSQRGAYIGLAERRALYIAGSDVRNLSANTVNGGVVEFADIAVVQ